jgi:signal transduction histidine kinase
MLTAVESDSRALPLLYRVSTLLGRDDDPATALGFALDAALETFAAVSGSISLLNPDTGLLEIEVQRGLDLPPSDIALKLGRGITGWVAFHARAQLVPDVTRDPRYVCVRPDVRCEMAVPLPGPNGQVLGVVNLDADQPDAFTPADLHLFGRFAAELAAVMRRLWQLQHLQGKARQLEALIATGSTLVTKLEPNELFTTLARDARRLVGGHAGAFYLHDPATGAVELVTFEGPAATVLPAGPQPLTSSLVASVVHTRRHAEFANIRSPEFIDVTDLPRADDLCSLLAVPVAYEGEVLGVLAVFTDHLHRFNNDEKRLLGALGALGAVTLQNVRLYARVFQSEESLRKNEQLTTLGLLAAEIAHEIRNPLTVLKLLFGSLDLAFPPEDPRQTDVRVIGEKLDQLEAIVSRVLSFGKAPASLHSRWDVADIIADTLVLVRLKLAQGNIRLDYLPPPAPLHVEVNKGQLQQVLINLLFNATQAMPAGGVITLTVFPLERPEGGRAVCIDVSDTGGGIPDRLRERVFDSFLSGRDDGTGLGLAIAKRILAGHHGDIHLRETGPAGTTMRVTLPLASAPR